MIAEVFRDRLDHPVAIGQQRQIVVEVPHADARRIGGIVKRRRLALLERIQRLHRDRAARARLCGNIQQNHRQAGIRQVRRNPRAHGPGAQDRRFADHRGWRAVCRSCSGFNRLDGCFNSSFELLLFRNDAQLATFASCATSPCVKVRAN